MLPVWNAVKSPQCACVDFQKLCVDNIKSPYCFGSWFLSFPACMCVFVCLCVSLCVCVCVLNRGSTLYFSPHCVFLSHMLVCVCAAGSETDPTTADGCPTRGRPAVIITDRVTVWVTQCVMKANLCTLGCGRFVSWLPLRWLLWWRRFLAGWQCFCRRRVSTFC